MPNPKKDPGIKKTHNMKVLLDDTQYALVQSAAKTAGMKMAAYMRHQAILPPYLLDQSSGCNDAT